MVQSRPYHKIDTKWFDFEQEGQIGQARFVWADTSNTWNGQDSVMCDHYRLDINIEEEENASHSGVYININIKRRRRKEKEKREININIEINVNIKKEKIKCLLNARRVVGPYYLAKTGRFREAISTHIEHFPVKQQQSAE